MQRRLTIANISARVGPMPVISLRPLTDSGTLPPNFDSTSRAARTICFDLALPNNTEERRGAMSLSGSAPARVWTVNPR